LCAAQYRSEDLTAVSACGYSDPHR